jgi:hypothetical protein
MRLDPLGDLNWLAVIVGAVIYFAIGAVWFTPIPLGRQWQRARNRLGLDAPPTGDEPDHLRRSGAGVRRGGDRHRHARGGDRLRYGC